MAFCKNIIEGGSSRGLTGRVHDQSDWHGQATRLCNYLPRVKVSAGGYEQCVHLILLIAAEAGELAYVALLVELHEGLSFFLSLVQFLERISLATFSLF